MKLVLFSLREVLTSDPPCAAHGGGQGQTEELVKPSRASRLTFLIESARRALLGTLCVAHYVRTLGGVWRWLQRAPLALFNAISSLFSAFFGLSEPFRAFLEIDLL